MYCTVPVSLILHVPPVIKLFLSRRSRIPYSYVATCRISTKEREHASQSKRRRPQYGNHSTNLPFGNDEHTLYKTILSEQCLQYTKKSSIKRLQPLGKKKSRDAELASSLLFMLNLLIQQPNYIQT